MEDVFASIPHLTLRERLALLSAHIGPTNAIHLLQRLLHVSLTGELDGATISTLWRHDPLLICEALALSIPGLKAS